MNEAQMQGRLEVVKRRVTELFAEGRADRTSELNGKFEQRFGWLQVSYGEGKQKASGSHRAVSADPRVLDLTA